MPAAAASQRSYPKLLGKAKSDVRQRAGDGGYKANATWLFQRTCSSVCEAEKWHLSCRGGPGSACYAPAQAVDQPQVAKQVQQARRNGCAQRRIRVHSCQKKSLGHENHHCWRNSQAPAYAYDAFCKRIQVQPSQRRPCSCSSRFPKLLSHLAAGGEHVCVCRCGCLHAAVSQSMCQSQAGKLGRSRVKVGIRVLPGRMSLLLQGCCQPDADIGCGWSHKRCRAFASELSQRGRRKGVQPNAQNEPSRQGDSQRIRQDPASALLVFACEGDRQHVGDCMWQAQELQSVLATPAAGWYDVPASMPTECSTFCRMLALSTAAE